MNTVQVSVNQSRLIANLGSVFSSNSKVLAELFQNARRAGATRIDVVKTGQLLTVADNGSGITNFSDLLTLAQSNWDEDVMSEESPYGMGFFSALFSADRVVVKSLGKQIEIDAKEDLLEQAISVMPSTVMVGTVVELYGSKIPDVLKSLTAYCKGFPIDVYFTGLNGDRIDSEWVVQQLVSSPDRLGSEFTEFEYGHIRYEFSSLKHSISPGNFIAYLQGFEVARHCSNYCYNESTIARIHLNGEFKARMPDRDCLINAKAEIDKITSSMRSLWIANLLKLKKDSPQDLFGYFDLAKELGVLGIFNDLDFLPGSFIGRTGDPIKYSEGRSVGLEIDRDFGDAGPWLAKPFFSDKLIVKGDPTQYDNENDDYEMALQMALYKDRTMVLAKTLDPGHWIYQYTKDLPDCTIDKPVQVNYTPIKSGKWECLDVHIVDSYSITVPSLGIHVVIDKDDGLAIGCDEYGNGDNELIIPLNANASVLQQFRTWYWDDSYHASEEDEDTTSLNAYIDVLRGKDDAEVLHSLLNRTDWIIRNALAGKEFTVRFLEKGEIEVNLTN